MVKGQVGEIVHMAVTGAEQQLHALGDGYAGFGQHAKADFGAGKILHDGDGSPDGGFHLTDALDNGNKVRRAAMREIESKYTDSGLGQFVQFFFAVGSGTDSSDNFRSHICSFWLKPVAQGRKSTKFTVPA